MATGDQIKALIKSHFDNENERFTTLSLQIAAHNAKSGYLNLANDIKQIVDKSKLSQPRLKLLTNDLSGMVLEVDPHERFSDLILDKALRQRIDKILLEYHQKEKLHKYGLHNRRKILLAGSPGTGKTMTASVIAHEVRLPLYIVLMDKLVTKFMGETSTKLRQIFELIASKKGVYLFDEFDAIGGERGKDNDVGEMRRVLNSFLQFIERDGSESLIIAITNNASLLDQALFRRFDDVLHYTPPTKSEILSLLNNKLGTFKGSYKLETIATNAIGLSHSEITQACYDAIKDSILNDNNRVPKEILSHSLVNRSKAYSKT